MSFHHIESNFFILKNVYIYILEIVKKNAKITTIFLNFFLIIYDTPIYKIYIIKFVNTTTWLHTPQSTLAPIY